MFQNNSVKKITALFTALTMLVLICFSPFVNINAQAKGKDAPSSWAEEAVDTLKNLQLYKEDAFKNYQADISRAEFIYLLVRTYEYIKKTTIEIESGFSPFDDTENLYAKKAYKMGLTKGVDTRKFNPDGKIDRQQALTFISRLIPVGTPYVGAFRFSDDIKMPDWSKDSIYKMYELGIVKGISATEFAPTLLCSTETAITMLYRFLAIEDTDSNTLIPYFIETFDDKTIYNNLIQKGTDNIWSITNAEGQKNSISDTGELELGGSQYIQHAVLNKSLWQEKQDFIIDFKINVQQLGNVGNSSRPIAVIMPRSKDESLSQYYAITYHMEEMRTKGLTANLFRCKWSLINTAAPSGMNAIAEGFYLLEENFDYTGRLIIHNTEDGNVNIKFYIDGAKKPLTEFKPLIDYTDSSIYKILSSATGPAFGTAGYSNDLWGVNPIVRFDDIKLFDYKDISKYTCKAIKHYNYNLTAIRNDVNYKEIRFLMNEGIINSSDQREFNPKEIITESDFLKLLITTYEYKYNLNPTTQKIDVKTRALELGFVTQEELNSLNSSLTKYKAAIYITRLNKNAKSDPTYIRFIGDNERITNDTLINSVLYTFEKGYLRLDENFNFNGDAQISKSQASILIMRLINPGYKEINYSLTLPSIIASGSVFQRDQNIPIWGRGLTGDTITVKFKNQTKTAVVKDGFWSLELNPEPAGGPYDLTVYSTKEIVYLENIYVGDVFIVAGQSNAEMPLSECNDAQATIDKLNTKKYLHFYQTQKLMAVSPRFSSLGYWESASDPDVLNNSSAIGAFFLEEILELNKDLENIPVGIIALTYGGSTIELFMPKSATAKNGFVQKDDNFIMSGFWNGFMKQATPYHAKAVLYYQGENSSQLGYGYEPLLRDFIEGFRKEFSNSKLPFVMVQLAGYGENFKYGNFPLIRDVQQIVADSTENTSLVTAVDLADADPMDIHPKNKKDIGIRLANMVLEKIYHKEGGCQSGKLKSCIFEDDKIVISFDYNYGDMYFKGDANSAYSFEILDSISYDWVPAKAKINKERNMLEITYDLKYKACGVRYAWYNYPTVTLYNSRGYPVLPFLKLKEIERTNESILKIDTHTLNNYDAVINVTRNNQLSMVNILSKNILFHPYKVTGQTAGDVLKMLSRLSNQLTEMGTTETVVKMKNHGLEVSDWIRNNSRGWKAREVLQVIDKDTFVIACIEGQTTGDEIEKFKMVAIRIAE